MLIAVLIYKRALYILFPPISFPINVVIAIDKLIGILKNIVDVLPKANYALV